MAATCPCCHTSVENLEEAFQCSSKKCVSWVHYYCTKLPLYFIVALEKQSSQKYHCDTCIHNKYKDDFPAIGVRIETATKKQEQTVLDIQRQAVGPENNNDNDNERTEHLNPINDTIIEAVGTDGPQPTPLNESDTQNDSAIAHAHDTTSVLDNSIEISGESTRGKENCFYYMQGSCKHGKKGTHCRYEHPEMCRKYLRMGTEGCNKDKECRYVHPKLCGISKVTKKCHRKICHFYHQVDIERPNMIVFNKHQLQQTRPRTMSIDNTVADSNYQQYHHNAENNDMSEHQLTDTNFRQPTNEKNDVANAVATFLGQLKDIQNQIMQELRTQTQELFNQMITQARYQLQTPVQLQQPRNVSYPVPPPHWNRLQQVPY